MLITVDASVIMAVVTNEPSKASIVGSTRDTTLISPGSLPWEIGSALSSLFKRGRLNLEQAKEALNSYREIPIRLVDIDLDNAVGLAYQSNIYAYDAYILLCASTYKTPLLTLDKRMINLAKSKGLQLLR